MNKREQNKIDKRKRILDASFNLFSTVGYSKTSIDQIINDANVAKGTFYLYFKDKSDLYDNLIIKIANDIFKDAAFLTSGKYNNYTDRFIKIVDIIIDIFDKNPNTLIVIKKNLSWELINRAIQHPYNHKVRQLIIDFKSYVVDLGFSEYSSNQLLYMIVDIVVSVSYSSLIIDKLNTSDFKPLIRSSIKALIHQNQIVI